VHIAILILIFESAAVLRTPAFCFHEDGSLSIAARFAIKTRYRDKSTFDWIRNLVCVRKSGLRTISLRRGLLRALLICRRCYVDGRGYRGQHCRSVYAQHLRLGRRGLNIQNGSYQYSQREPPNPLIHHACMVTVGGEEFAVTVDIGETTLSTAPFSYLRSTSRCGTIKISSPPEKVAEPVNRGISVFRRFLKGNSHDAQNRF